MAMNPVSESESAVCAHLCFMCLRGIALMGRDPLRSAELAFVLPRLGEWIEETYGMRQLKSEARA